MPVDDRSIRSHHLVPSVVVPVANSSCAPKPPKKKTVFQNDDNFPTKLHEIFLKFFFKVNNGHTFVTASVLWVTTSALCVL